jgi:hypothetical protein
MHKDTKIWFVGVSKQSKIPDDGFADIAVTCVNHGNQVIVNWSPCHHTTGGKVAFSLMPYKVYNANKRLVPGIREPGIHEDKFRFATIPMDDVFYSSAPMRALDNVFAVGAEPENDYQIGNHDLMFNKARDLTRKVFVQGDAEMQVIDLYIKLEILSLCWSMEDNIAANAATYREVANLIIREYTKLIDRASTTSILKPDIQLGAQAFSNTKQGRLQAAKFISKGRLVLLNDWRRYCDTFFMGTCLNDCPPAAPLHLRVNS